MKMENKKREPVKVLERLMATKTPIRCEKNPVIQGLGICDPHIQLFEGKVYLYSGHDCNPDKSEFGTDRWTVWSTEDFVTWTPESFIFSDDFFMGKTTNACWAADAAEANGRYYFYYSNLNVQTGVAVSDRPFGPFKDAESSPILDGTLTPTREYDPAIFKDVDGSAYIVFGAPAWCYGEGCGYYIAKLSEDMVTLAETPRYIELDHEGDDKPSLNRIGDKYYLTFSSFYAISDNVYGPYHLLGNTGASADHGSYLEWNGQLFNCFTIYDPLCLYRAPGICYVHQKANYELVVDPMIVEYGVGQYDGNWNRIEAEWYMKIAGAAKKVENMRYGFDVEVSGGEEAAVGELYFPKIRNVRGKRGIALFTSCNCPEGAEIEVWQTGAEEKLLGSCRVPVKRRHSWRSYRIANFLIDPLDLDTVDLKIVIRVNGKGSCRLDSFRFYP